MLAALGPGPVRRAYVQGPRGVTALMERVRARDLAGVAHAIAKGADVDAIAEGVETALSIACAIDAEPLVAQLLAAGANPETPIRGHGTVLHLAAARSSPAVVRRLLVAGARIARGESPLAVAIACDRPEVLEVLLAHDVPDPAEAFAAACAHGRVAALRRLRARFGAAAWDARGLMAAAAGGHTEAVALLVELGADVNVYDLKDERSPLMHAVGGGHLETARALLAAGADANAMTEWFVTPLGIARQRGDAAMIALLAEHGARADTPHADVHVVLPYATYSNRPPRPAAPSADDDVAAFAAAPPASLDGALADLAAAGAYHCTAYALARGAALHGDCPRALVAAIRGCHAPIVRVMLAAIPPAAALDCALLAEAVHQPDPWILRGLLERIAPHPRDATLTDSAAAWDRHAHLALLLAHGAPYGEHGNAQSALATAARAGHVRSVRVLLDHERATGGFQRITDPGYQPALRGTRRIDRALALAEDPATRALLVAYGAR